MRRSWMSGVGVVAVAFACGGPQASAPNDTNSTPCVEAVAPNDECPATWAETIPAGKAFCGGRGKSPMFTLARSNGPCESYLRYSVFLFDGGPRNCLYDPKTEKLAGYGFFDAKAGWQQRTCNIEQKEAAFPESCAHLTCTDAAFAP